MANRDVGKVDERIEESKGEVNAVLRDAQRCFIREKGFGPREILVALVVSRDSRDLKDHQRSKEPRLLSKLTCKYRIYLKTPRDTPKTSKDTQRHPKTPQRHLKENKSILKLILSHLKAPLSYY